MTGKTVVVLGTATPGGGFPAYGAPYAETINEMDPTLSVEPRNTKGSTENVPLLEQDKLDIGLATGEVTYEAIAGIGRAKATNLRIINATYSQAGMFMVRADSANRSILDLKGKRVVWGAGTSGFIVLARYVMDGLGLDIRKDFEAILLEKAGDGPPLVLDGHAAAMWGGGVGWPPFTAIAKGPAGARFIAPRPDEIERITAKHSFLKPNTLPAGSYPGQDQPIRSVGSWPFVLARASLPEDVAYRLARALHRGEATLGKRLEQARESTLANTLAAAPRQDLIHPGVLRYMREIGLVRSSEGVMK
ncbi:MAG: immunogenic protein precursor [Betaproteobacteria bacterium RIFCSPLOWO2_12_FULL_62_58]|nr:MAG: immunogenic protein precursor [Betaproteobacteria bacterium RIFCSPLOWO2_12_FULL_62_58]